MNTNTEKAVPKHNPRVPVNVFLNPRDYSRYSFNKHFLGDVDSIMESISHLDEEFEGSLNLLDLLIQQSTERNLKLELIRYITDLGLVMAIGTEHIPNISINIPIRWAFLESIVGPALHLDKQLEPYIKAGYINKHYTEESSNVMEILSEGLETYVSNTIDNYETFDQLLGHLISLGDSVDEEDLSEYDLENYMENIYKKVDIHNSNRDNDLISQLDIIYQYYKMDSHQSLNPLTHLDKEEQAKYSTGNTYNVIHSYLRLWQTGDTTQKDI